METQSQLSTSAPTVSSTATSSTSFLISSILEPDASKADRSKSESLDVDVEAVDDSNQETFEMNAKSEVRSKSCEMDRHYPAECMISPVSQVHSDLLHRATASSHRDSPIGLSYMPYSFRNPLIRYQEASRLLALNNQDQRSIPSAWLNRFSNRLFRPVGKYLLEKYVLCTT